MVWPVAMIQHTAVTADFLDAGKVDFGEDQAWGVELAADQNAGFGETVIGRAEQGGVAVVFVDGATPRGSADQR